MTHIHCVSPTRSGRLKQVVQLSGTRADPCSLHLLLNLHWVISSVRERWVFPPISSRRASFPPRFPEAFISRNLLIWAEKSQNPPSFFFFLKILHMFPSLFLSVLHLTLLGCPPVFYRGNFILPQRRSKEPRLCCPSASSSCSSVIPEVCSHRTSVFH